MFSVLTMPALAAVSETKRVPSGASSISPAAETTAPPVRGSQAVLVPLTKANVPPTVV